ncbi:hypothetical protein SY83_16155 [Paenibacillus swuensis]|uniref:Uncharacterized protein n=1 Tax=Paenibacillus swuensis TaxID=1178515 RepID=A0A172TKK6_9BACL|nr:hypothetical protein [Paenibacillus swuensis]ANE47560.1 hypothetical protein SY83_16155 [Paenibacillus swuensis]
MIGTIRWNVIGALAGMLLTFGLSSSTNLLQTSVIRSLYCFALVFFIIFFLRWLAGLFMAMGESSPELTSSSNHDEEMKGSTLDYTTPDDGQELHELLKEGHEAERIDLSFSPLEPPQLINKNKLQPEELAKAIRHLNE